jgi:cytochrome c oxidase subunit II
MTKNSAGNSIILIVGLVMYLGILPGLPVLAQQPEQVIKVQAKRFTYIPSEITLNKGVPVVLEMTSLDVLHGFNCPDLGLHANIYPGKITNVRVVPDKTGSFPFHCDVYCGEGHEDMTGVINVIE